VIPPTGGGGGGGVSTAAHVATQSLPFTGVDVLELLVIGIVLLVIGAALLLRRRKHVSP
jgi:LPXTG-motif cell wall-anchored protein